MKKTLFILISLFVIPLMVAQTVVTHPWQGKRVAFFGDSIIDPDINNASNTVPYWLYLQDWLGITPFVYGVSGRQWDDIPRQATELKAERGDDFDAIIILMGTNDYNISLPIGEWFTEQIEYVYEARGTEKSLVSRKRQYPCMSDSTYRGRINIGLSTIKKMFPTKQIVVLTPIHRAGFYYSRTNWQPAEDYQNQCGEYLSAYVESVKEAGNIWSVPVIDLNAECGLYPLLDEYAVFFRNAEEDRLHPNSLGHARIAQTLLYRLLTIPCVFPSIE